MKATRDGNTFTIQGGKWSGTYPLEELPRWLEFYQRQRAKFPKANGAYDATIAALEGLAEGLTKIAQA